MCRRRRDGQAPLLGGLAAPVLLPDVAQPSTVVQVPVVPAIRGAASNMLTGARGRGEGCVADAQLTILLDHGGRAYVLALSDGQDLPRQQEPCGDKFAELDPRGLR